MGVPTYWSGADNGGIVGYRGIYCSPPEHGHAIHCDLSYHELVFCGGGDAGNAPIQEMVVTDRPGYHGDQGSAGSHRGERGNGGGGRSRRGRERRGGEDNRDRMIW